MAMGSTHAQQLGRPSQPLPLAGRSSGAGACPIASNPSSSFRPGGMGGPPRPLALNQLLPQLKTAMEAAPRADWLSRQLRPALLRKLPLGATDLPLRRERLLAELEKTGDLTHLLQLYMSHAQRAVPLLAELLQPPQQSAMLPSTAQARAAAATNSAPAQFAATGSGSAEGGKASALTQLKAELAVLHALIGPDGVLRMLLSDGESSSGEVSNLILSPLLTATWSGPRSSSSNSGSGSVLSLLLMTVDQLRALGPHASAFQLKATFTPLHDLNIPTLCTHAMQLLCQLLPLDRALQDRSADAAQDRSVVVQRLVHALQMLNSISEAREDSTRIAEWKEQIHRLTPSQVQHSSIVLHVASAVRSLTGAKRSVGGLQTAADVATAGPSSFGAVSSSQHMVNDANSQVVETSGSPCEAATQQQQPQSVDNVAARTAAATALRKLMLQLLKELYTACAHVSNMDGAQEHTRNKVSGSALDTRSSRNDHVRSPTSHTPFLFVECLLP